MNVRKKDGSVWEFQGAGTVDGNSAVSARLVLEGSNLADRNPELASADETCRQVYRDLLPQIWSQSGQG